MPFACSHLVFPQGGQEEGREGDIPEQCHPQCITRSGNDRQEMGQVGSLTAALPVPGEMGSGYLALLINPRGNHLPTQQRAPLSEPPPPLPARG